MAKYDPLAKKLGRLKPLDFVKCIYPKTPIEKVTFEDREFEFTNRRVDLLYRVKPKNEEEFYFHLEFQGALDKKFLERMLLYSARITEAFKKPVKTVVIFLKSTQEIRSLPCPAKWSWGGEDLVTLNYTKIVLPEENWKNFYKKGMEAFLPLIPLMRIPFGEEKKVLRQTIRKIEKIETEEIRKEFAALFYVVGKDKYEESFVEQLIGEKLMEELLESKTLQSIKNQGKEEQLQDDILKVLKARFKKVPKNLKEKIMEVHQIKKLNVLFDEALNIETLSQIEVFLDSPKNKK